MAFLDDQNKNQNQNPQAQNQNNAQAPGQAANSAANTGGAPVQATSAPNVSGSGGADVGGVVPSATGSGGNGGWTNIQAYINANQGDTGSAQNLSSQAQGKFSQEQGQMQDQSNKALQAGQSDLNKTNISNDQANQMINSNVGAYDWSGNQGQGYNDNVNKVQTALNSKYQAPTSFSYALGGDTQNYGNALQSNPGFQNIMGQIYNQKAGTPLTSGQMDLQNQLDASNSNLTQARNNAIGQYSGLQGKADQLNLDTTNALQGDQQQFYNNQTNLNQYLTGQANDYQSKINQEEAAATQGYNNALHSADNIGSGANAVNQALQQSFGAGNSPFTHQAGNYISDPGANWSDLQNYLSAPNPGYGPKGFNLQAAWNTMAGDMPYGFAPGNAQNVSDNLAGYEPTAFAAQNNWNQNAQNSFNNFQQQQQQAYGNTANNEKQAFNTIQDFLGTNAPKQTQGFDYFGANPQYMSDNGINGPHNGGIRIKG